MPLANYSLFVVPAFGLYRLEVKARSEKSKEGEVIGINLGDGRHPTSFRMIRRIPMPHGSKGFTTELTLKAGDRLAFTFDSARVPGRSLVKKEHKGPAMRFSRLKVTGPLTEQWPTAAMEAILPKPNMKPTELVDHIALLLTQRPLTAEDRKAFVEIAQIQEKSGASITATARSVLIALLTSPQLIYKSEPPDLTSVELAHRLSYFLWNSVPDAKLLAFAKSGGLGKDPSAQVERILKDARAGRFIDDFTRLRIGGVVKALNVETVTRVFHAACVIDHAPSHKRLIEHRQLHADARRNLIRSRLAVAERAGAALPPCAEQ